MRYFFHLVFIGCVSFAAAACDGTVDVSDENTPARPGSAAVVDEGSSGPDSWQNWGGSSGPDSWQWWGGSSGPDSWQWWGGSSGPDSWQWWGGDSGPDSWQWWGGDSGPDSWQWWGNGDQENAPQGQDQATQGTHGSAPATAAPSSR
jgi:hypothetical protein